MLQHLYLCQNTSDNPYENLALERLLLNSVPEDAIILYLWQNAPTVVIGRNQNAWRECRLEQMEKDHVFLARRPSGGGAVYHDPQNLNFSFIAHAPYDDFHQQSEVLLRAAASFGIHAEFTGRNDVTVDGRKFSGSAFYHAGPRCCYHGTTMIHVDTSAMAKYLSVSRKKLPGGVASVRSRVINLAELVPDLTAADFRTAMAGAFSEVYGLPVETLDPPAGKELEDEKAHLSSRDWIYGRKIPFTAEYSERFRWGEVQLQLSVSRGVIEEAKCCSDALEENLIERVAGAVSGLPFEYTVIREAVMKLASNEQEALICRDIAGLVQE